MDSKFSLYCEGKKMVREVMEKQQAKFVYLDMPDFGLDVLLVQPRSYEIVYESAFAARALHLVTEKNTQCFQSVCSILSDIFANSFLWNLIYC